MNDGYIDRLKHEVLDLVSPVGEIMTAYHPDAADINESLDAYHGNVASCAVRAYAAGLLIRDTYPNPNLYQVEFGYDHEHGADFVGENGIYPKMGHAVTRLWIPERPRLVIESDRNGSIEVVMQDDRHDSYVWAGLDEGYRSYLDMANLDDRVIDADEILVHLVQKIDQLRLAA